ncbi:MAG: PHP domain-containing protein [Lachnospiraceae bacterium]|nr:PHP domain-containing protein [Lachnospiraceae bacterium]
MEYIYETHLHTIEASACSETPAREYIEHMMRLGYSGMIVTDHFFNGNSAVPKNLPWEEKVNMYCKGYENALQEAEGKDFNVFFGIEFCFEGDEYLIYGVDKEWLLKHPEIMEVSRSELLKMVHEAGGMLIQAHPYRERDYLSAIRLAPNDVDGCEGYNAGNPDYQNALGYQYGLKHNFLMSGGSDIHQLSQKTMGGVAFPYKINTIEEYIEAFLKGDGTAVIKKDVDSPDARFVPVSECPELTSTTEKPTLSVIIY